MTSCHWNVFLTTGVCEGNFAEYTTKERKWIQGSEFSLKSQWHGKTNDRSHIKIIHNTHYHYSDVKMGTMASQITSLTIVYSTVYSGADQRKHQSSESLAFVRGIHRGRWIPHTNGQQRGKCFQFMTLSCSDVRGSLVTSPFISYIGQH